MDDFLYRKIDVPDIETITEEMRSMLAGYDLSIPRFSVIPVDRIMGSMPCLGRYFSKHGLEPIAACLIVIAGPSDQVIHVDYLKTDICLAMNFPVSGCEEAYTSFYENKGVLTLQHTPKTNLPYYNYFDPDPQEVDRFVLDGPTVLRITVPHAVHNHGSSNRVCMSFRFSRDPWELVR